MSINRVRTKFKNLNQVEKTVKVLINRRWQLSDGKEVCLKGKYIFTWDGASKRFGRCQYCRPPFKRGKISLSKKLVSLNLGNAQVYDTILHELAHAISWEMYKYRGHGARWKWVAKEIGATPSRCYNINAVTVVPGKYKVECEKCGNTFYWQRKPKYKTYICNRCKSIMKVQELI